MSDFVAWIAMPVGILAVSCVFLVFVKMIDTWTTDE